MINAPMMMSGATGTPALRVHVKVVFVNTGTAAAGNTFTATGIVDKDGNSFAVKAIAVFRHSKTTNLIEGGNPGLVGGYGLATSDGTERAIGFTQPFNALSSNARGSYRTDSVGMRYQHNNATNGRATAAGGFGTPGQVTFTIGVAFTVSERWMVVAFGGDDFDARIVDAVEPGSTGAHAVNISGGPGLVPKGLISIGAGIATANTNRNDIAVHLGFAAVSGGQAVIALGDNFGSDPTVISQYLSLDSCVAIPDDAGTGISAEAALTGAASDQVTLTWSARTAAARITPLLVLYKCGVTVASFQLPTAQDATENISTPSLASGGILAATYGISAESTAATPTRGDFTLSIGAFDSPTSRGGRSYFDNDADGTTSTGVGATESHVLVAQVEASQLTSVDVSAVSSSAVTVKKIDAPAASATLGVALILHNP